MGRKDGFDRQIRDAEKERRRRESKEKWEKRERNFWKTFLFTEDGKPKSGLVIYTFCLSFVLLAVYLLAFDLVIEGLTPVMEGWPAALANLLQALAASAIGLAASWVLHRLCSDKRLAFGSPLWLALYAAAVLITMVILLWGTGATGVFLVFFGWFVLIPLALGLLVTFLLYRRDYRPPHPGPGDEPEWKKYIRRQ